MRNTHQVTKVTFSLFTGGKAVSLHDYPICKGHHACSHWHYKVKDKFIFTRVSIVGKGSKLH